LAREKRRRAERRVRWMRVMLAVFDIKQSFLEELLGRMMPQWCGDGCSYHAATGFKGA
jgi:hypothetical protein